MKSIALASVLVLGTTTSAIALPFGGVNNENRNNNSSESSGVGVGVGISANENSNQNNNAVFGVNDNVNRNANSVSGATLGVNESVNRNRVDSQNTNVGVTSSESFGINESVNFNDSSAEVNASSAHRSNVFVEGDRRSYREGDRRQYTNIPSSPVGKEGYSFSASGAYSGQSISLYCPTGGSSFSLGIWLGGVSGSNSSTKLPKECKQAMGSLDEVLRRDAALLAGEIVGGDAQKVLAQEIIYKYMESLGLSRDRAESILKIQQSATSPVTPSELQSRLDDSDRIINAVKAVRGDDYYRR